MRILLTPFGSRGDVQPLLALGVGLRARGHDVHVGASSTFGAWVEQLGFPFYDVGGDVEARVRGLGPLQVLPAIIRYLREDIRQCFDATREAAAGADLVVTTIHLAARSVAEAVGIPCRTVVLTAQMVPSRFHPPIMVPWMGLPHAVNRTLWWTVQGAFDLLFRGAVNRERQRLGLPPVPSYLAHARGTDPLVVSDAPLAPLPPDAPPSVIQTGALVLPALDVLEPELDRFLRNGDPPIYFGFGSMPDPEPALTARLVVEAAHAAGRRLVICAGWAGTGGFNVPDGVMVVSSAPHGALFPRLAAVIHHGGAGTTAAAARAGVPQVVVPHLGDQFYHARKVADAGLGPKPIPRGRLNAPRLASALRSAVSESEFRARAAAMAEALRSVDGVSTAVDILVSGA